MTAERRLAGSIYDGFSPRGQRALADLRVEFQAAGFYAEKERRTERTLRVYPEKRWRYPLLNPWLERPSPGSRARRPAVMCPVYSDGDVLIQRLLDGMAPVRGCSYLKSPPRPPSRYFLHGYLILPLAFLGEARSQSIDFGPMRPTLAALHLELSRAGW